MEIQMDLPEINSSNEPTPIPLQKSDGCFSDIEAELISTDDDAKNVKNASSDKIIE